MRIRTIKPEFWTSFTLSSLPPVARLAFIGLWNYADDEGRAVNDERLVKAALFPLDDDMTVRKVRALLDQLCAAGVITIYEVGGRSYLVVNGWNEHQVISHSRPSVLPEPPGEPAGSMPEDSGLEVEVEVEGKGTGKEQHLATLPRRRARDPVWEAMLAACGVDSVPRPARGGYNAALAAIKAVWVTDDLDDFAISAEVTRRAENYRRHFADAALTPSALAKHWGLVANAPSIRQPDRRGNIERNLRAIEGRR